MKTLLRIAVILAMFYACQGQDGLVAFYPFNGNSRDESGNGNDAVPFGATLGEDMFGCPDNAYSFNGHYQYLRAEDSPSLNSEAVTVSAWVKWEDMRTEAENPFGLTVASKLEVNGVHSWAFGIFRDGRLLPQVNANGEWRYFLCKTRTLSNVWNHVVMTCDGVTLRGFVNGALDGFMFCGGSITPTPTPLRIGASANDSTNEGARIFFSGSIDTVRIYNRSMLPDEVRALFLTESKAESGCSHPLPLLTLNSAYDCPSVHVQGNISESMQLVASTNGVDWFGLNVVFEPWQNPIDFVFWDEKRLLAPMVFYSLRKQ